MPDPGPPPPRRSEPRPADHDDGGWPSLDPLHGSESTDADGLGARLGELRRRLGLDVRVVAWAATALVAVAVGAWLLRPSPTPFEETIPTASSTAPPEGEAAAPAESGTPGAADPSAASSSSLPTEVVAHAAGAVVRPGVYRLDPTARVDDLVRSAGGLAPDADAARLNLAAPLADGARVYVPRVGEEDPPEVAGPDAPAGPTPGDGSAPDGTGPDGSGPEGGLIDINTATEAELDVLPGVGPATAAAIIGYRTENGGFSSVDELLEVRGIGEAKLADISPLVTV